MKVRACTTHETKRRPRPRAPETAGALLGRASVARSVAQRVGQSAAAQESWAYGTWLREHGYRKCTRSALTVLVGRRRGAK